MSALAALAEQLALERSPEGAPSSYVAEYEQCLCDAFTDAADSVTPPDLEEHQLGEAQDAAERMADVAREAEVEEAMLR